MSLFKTTIPPKLFIRGLLKLLFMNRSSVILFIGLSLSLVSCRVFRFSEFREMERSNIFSVSEVDNCFILNGVINSSALRSFKTLCQIYPDIKKINIVNCDGSINDDVNLQLAAYVHEKGFNIHLMDNAEIASGGVDFFLAGIKRTCGDNTKIGVHSWSEGRLQATDLAEGHKYHQEYIDYYRTIGFTQQQAEDFYYFTIYAAPPEEVHWMTEKEILYFKLITG